MDDPANELPGWMVTKATGSPDALLLVLADEMETLTKASDSKQPYGDVTYADPGYQKDGKKRYPLDTEAHVRAAWSYINQEGNGDVYSDTQLASIKGKIKSAMTKLGATVEADAKKTSIPTNIVATIKGIILGAPTGKEQDMEKDELVAAIVEGNAPLVTAVTEALTKSAPAPAAAATEPVVEATPLTIEDVTKAVETVIEEHVTKVYNEVLEKVLDRIESIEKHNGIAARKSLEGQEGAAGTEGTAVAKSAPDLGDAIASAFTKR